MRLKKYIAEFLGTAILVLFGCGTAVFCGGLSGGTGNGTLGVVSIALAFGLSIVAGAYSIGHISGCHVNPAVSLAMFINGKLDIIDLIGYIVSQVAHYQGDCCRRLGLKRLRRAQQCRYIHDGCNYR